MIKPLLLISLLAQINVAPTIGDGNTAPAIGEQTQPVQPEPQPKPKSTPIAVQSKVQPVATPDDLQAPVNIPVPEPLPSDSVDLAPPVELPALEATDQSWDDIPPPEDSSYDPIQPQASSYPQGQAPQPAHGQHRPPPQNTPSARSAVSYQKQTVPIQPAPQFTTENIGYPLTSWFAATSAFGWRTHPVNGDSSFHAGVDLAAPPGTPTLAMLSGRVTHADWEGGYGKSVVIEHPGTGLKSRYAHLSTIHVQPGQWVDKGWHIADSGATGLVTGPHAHIEIIEGGKHIDPWPYLLRTGLSAVTPRFHAWAG